MFTLLCLCIWHVASVLTMETLYDWDEPIAQLHSSNFSDTIVDSDTAWVAVFYSTWCGHCQRFAPNYTEFANEVEGRWLSGIILCMRLASERWRYTVTPSLIGWAHTQNFVYASSQWEMALHCNAISHWLGAYTEWSLDFMKKSWHGKACV